MANMVVSLRIMPKGVDVSLDILKEAVTKIIDEFIDGGELKVEINPIAFGLSALDFIFAMDESKDLESLENQLKEIEDVNNVSVIDVRRAIG